MPSLYGNSGTLAVVIHWLLWQNSKSLTLTNQSAVGEINECHDKNDESSVTVSSCSASQMPANCSVAAAC